MRKLIIVTILCASGLPLFAQAADVTRLVPGAESQLTALLNKPAMVRPAVATPLGRNWFRLETDAHIFTNEVTLRQVASVLQDLDNQDKIYNGKKSKLSAKIVSTGASESIVDFISISVGPLGIQIRTPYRASVRTTENTDSRFVVEVRQLSQNSETNNDIKNLFATRYAEEVTIGGNTYTYIRIYTINEINASILPGAKGTLENNSAPVNEETLQMIITAAKQR